MVFLQKLCINQDKLGCAAITNILKISVVYENFT